MANCDLCVRGSGQRDASSYESEISCDAVSESECLYDLESRANAQFGLRTIALAASAEFQYQPEGRTESNLSAGGSVAWMTHRWIVLAQPLFAGDGDHALDFSVVF